MINIIATNIICRFFSGILFCLNWFMLLKSFKETLLCGGVTIIFLKDERAGTLILKSF